MARVYGIAGHGAGDPGACAHGYSEAERVRALGARMEALSGGEFVLLDPTRNWYADGGIYYLSLPRGAQLVELHMDSAGSGARGGHVVIDADFEPDGYDRALADFISGYFPGRSVTISKRNDLGNPNAAQYRGISYRLLECCFITSWEDLKKFNENLDDVARGILGALGIGDGIEEEEEMPITDEEIERIARRAAELTRSEILGYINPQMESVDVYQMLHDMPQRVWGYQNERFEKVDAYQILRDTRDATAKPVEEEEPTEPEEAE